MSVNQEPFCTPLLAPDGGIVTTFSSTDTAWRGRTPPLVELPRLPVTSAEWVEHEVDSGGHLSRVSKSVPALSVTVSSLAGSAVETGDGTPEHPFVNLGTFRLRFANCLIHALNCAGFTLSVTVTGTVDYNFTLAGGSAGDSVVYDFSEAEVVGSACMGRAAGDGIPVVRNLHAPCSVFNTTTYNMVFNDCSWGPPAVIRSRMMYRGRECAFDRCVFSAGSRSFFSFFDHSTVAGGTFRASGSDVFDGAENCVFSGVEAVCTEELGYPYNAHGAIVLARESIFERCSASLVCRVSAWNDDSANPDWYNAARAAAVKSCTVCAFDRCDAAVTLVSGGFRHLCFQACGFHANSGSVYNECRGNSIAEGYCSHSGYIPMPCEP